MVIYQLTWALSFDQSLSGRGVFMPYAFNVLIIHWIWTRVSKFWMFVIAVATLIGASLEPSSEL